ncbi:MAG: hypothetical protein ABFS42_06885 [Candidatus Krumholzibacteriota bacterium]
MSEQDRFDWNDDMELDSTNPEQEDFDDFEDPLDGFADYDDVSGYEDLSEMDAPTSGASGSEESAGSETAAAVPDDMAEQNAADETKATAFVKKKRRRGISATGLGFLFTASILVAGVGVGGAILLAEGVHPRTLWQPDNLMQVDQLLNFADHPLNILYMVTMGIVFLALLGSYKMSRAAVEANRRTLDAESMLDRLTALDLDNQKQWQSQEFKEFPPAEAFVIRTLGAWRLQEARQKRLMGVEGELHRLEKALNTNSREDLTGRFDHPAVGRLSDEMVRYFDAREVAVSKLQDHESKGHENTGEILDLLQKSRQWNGSTLDQLSVQCAALDELSGQMDNLARHIEKGAAKTGTGTHDSLTDIIEAIRRDLDNRTTGGGADGQSLSGLNDLVDRGSKLAFKIAMEVARLGPRGERLLPMSQSLEDLTTGFRKLADRANNQDGDTGQTPSFRNVHKKLETLAALITEDDQAHLRDLAGEVPDFGPAAARISSQLTRMADGFNEQEDRLVGMGSSFAEMTGADFDSTSIPRKELSEAPVASLDITRGGSPAKESEPSESPAEMDPFVASDSPLMSPDEKPEDADLTSPVLPAPDADGPARFNLDSGDAVDMPLPDDEEKVYDLEEFEAAPVMEPEVQDTEEVFELSDLGGVSMEQAAEPDAEEVHDLAEFGAMPLDQAAVSEPEEPADDDMVYDLADFSAKPLN